jgi:molybdate transport system regulatory protein
VAPLVRTAAGGQQGGGASVTAAGLAGLAGLAECRRMQQATDAVVQPYLAAFAGLRRDSGDADPAAFPPGA